MTPPKKRKGLGRPRKSSNRYRFKSIAERLSAINLANLYQKQYGRTLPHVTSKFNEELEELSLLDLTEEFSQFYKSYRLQWVTVDQVTHHQALIVETLVKLIDGCRPDNQTAVISFVKLFVGLARDLQRQFHVHYCSVFACLHRALTRHDCNPDVVEAIFHSLTIIFNICWRVLTRNYKKVFKMYKRLGSSSKPHIRQFAAETLCFLFRKVDDCTGAIADMLSAFKASYTAADIDFLNILFSETCKGMHGCLHQCAFRVLQSLFDSARSCEDQRASNILCGSFIHTLSELGGFCRSEPDQIKIIQTAQEFIGQSSENELLKCTCIGGGVAVCLKLQPTPPAQAFNSFNQTLLLALQSLKSSIATSGPVLQCFIDVSAYLATIPLNEQACDTFIDLVSGLSDNRPWEAVYSKLLDLCFFQNFRRVNLMCVATRSDRLGLLVAGLARWVLRHDPDPFRRRIVIEATSVRLFVVDEIRRLTRAAVDNLDMLASCLVVALKLDISDYHQAMEDCLEAIAACAESSRVFLFCLALEIDPAALSQQRKMEILLDKYASDSLLDIWLCTLICQHTCGLDDASMARIVEHYTYNLTSSNPFVRLSVLNSLKALLSNDSSARFEGLSVAVTSCLMIEQCSSDFECYREKTRLISQLNADVFLPRVAKASSLERVSQVCICYLIGILGEKLSLLWKAAIDTLRTYASRTRAVFMSICERQMQHFCDCMEYPNDLIDARVDAGSLLDTAITTFLARHQRKSNCFTAHSNLWTCFDSSTQSSDLVETHNRVLVPVLLRCSDRYNAMMSSKMNCPSENERLKSLRSLLINMINILSKSRNIVSFSQKDKIKSHLQRYIQSGDLKLSQASILLYKGFFDLDSSIWERVINLYNPKQFKSELIFIKKEIELSISAEGSSRDWLMDMLFRVLIGRLLQRDPKSHGHRHIRMKKKSILSVLFTMDQIYLHRFMRIALAPFDDTSSALDLDDFPSLLNTLSSTSSELQLRIDHIFGALTTVKFALEELNCRDDIVLSSMIFRSLCMSIAVSRHGRATENENNRILERLFRTSMSLLVKLLDRTAGCEMRLQDRNAISLLLNQQVTMCLTDANPQTISLKYFEVLEKMSYFANHRELFTPQPDGQHQICVDCVIIPIVNLPTQQIYPAAGGVEVNPVFAHCIQTLINLFSCNQTEDGDTPGPPDWALGCVSPALLRRLQNALNEVLVTGLGKRTSRLFRSQAKRDSISSVIQLLEWISSSTDTTGFDYDNLCVQLLGVINVSIRLPDDFANRILSMLSGYVKLVRNKEKLFGKLAEFLSTMKSTDGRRQLLDILTALASEPFKDIAKVIVDLNAFHRDKINEPDVTTRIGAIANMSQMLDRRQDDILIRVAIYSIGFILRESSEYSMRNAATGCLNRIVDLLATTTGTSRSLLVLILREVRACFRSDSQDAHIDACRVVRRLIHNEVDVSGLNGLKSLLSEDPEVDFFTNIYHIQSHRRSRALARLKTSLKAEGFSSTAKSHVIGPMLDCVIRDILRETPVKVDQRVVFERSIACAGWLICNQSKDKFCRSLSACVRTIKSSKAKASSVDYNIRLLLAVANEYPESIQNRQETEMFIIKTLIPALYTIVFEKKSYGELKDVENRGVLRASSGGIVICLLKQLSPHQFNLHFSGVILKLLNYLKSRLVVSRSKARQCLVKIMVALDEPWQRCYVFNEIMRHLKKGFERHVCVYTINTLLDATRGILKAGDLSECLDAIWKLLMEDIFGRLHEEKKSLRATVPEAKSTRSFDGLSIVAKLLSRDVALTFMLSFYGVLKRESDVRKIHDVQRCVQNVQTGLLANEDIDLETLLELSHSLAQKVSTVECNAVDNCQQNQNTRLLIAMPESCCIIPPEVRRSRNVNDKSTMRFSSYVLLTCSYQLAAKALKRIRSEQRAVEYRHVVDRLIPDIVATMDVKFIQVASSSLGCLDLILAIYGSQGILPTLHTNLTAIANRLSALFASLTGKTAGTHKSSLDVLRMCFLVLARLVSDVPEFRALAQAEQKEMATFVESQIINESEGQTYSFVLLRAMLKARLLPSSLKRILDKVLLMSFTSASRDYMDQSRRVILMYLRNYKITMKDLEKMVFTLTAQLDYHNQAGRLAVVRLLTDMVDLIPQATMDILFHGLLVTTLASLFNESIKDIYGEKRELLGRILRSVSTGTRLQQFEAILEELEGFRVMPKIRAACMVTLCLLLETDHEQLMGKGCRRILDVCVREAAFIHDGMDLTKGERGDVHPYQKLLLNEGEHTLNQHLHRICSLIQTVLVSPMARELLSSSRLVNIKGIAVELSQSRNVVCRLDGCDMLYQLLLLQTGPDGGRKVVVFGDREQLVTLVTQLCRVLHSSTSICLSDRMAATLYMVLKASRDTMEQTDDISAGQFERWLFGRVRHEADVEAKHNMSCTVVRNCVIKWVAAVASKLPPDVLWSHLRSVLPALQREADTAPHRNRAQGDCCLTTLARDTLELVKRANKDRLNEFLRVYEDVKSQRTARKTQRKQKLASMAVTNPGARAAVKMNRQMKKQIRRKEKKKNPFK